MLVCNDYSNNKAFHLRNVSNNLTNTSIRSDDPNKTKLESHRKRSTEKCELTKHQGIKIH